MIKIAGIEKESIVDGEGIRYVVFTQGCKHMCKGCHNPQTWDFNGGYYEDADNIINDIMSNPLLSGITLSGGDPFYRSAELMQLVLACENNGINIWAYTGFYMDEFLDYINNKNTNNEITDDMIEMLNHIDVLVDGPFELDKKTLDIQFRGSYNQRLIDVRESLKNNHIIEYTLGE